MSFSAPSGTSSPKNKISGYDVRQLQNFSPEMMNLFRSLLGGAQKGTSGGLDFLSGLANGDEEAFEDAEAPAYAAFNKSLGQIGSRFSQFGAQDSSAFQNAVSGAGGDLAQNLQSQRLGLRNNSIQSLLGLSNSLLGQRPTENLVQKKDSPWDTAGDVAGQSLKFLKYFL